jgi:hypothetical protein
MKAMSGLVGALLLAAVLVPSSATAVTLTMDEVPNQLIDGLTVSKGGMAFTFSNPAHTLFYNSFGPGHVTYVQDPSIQGSSSLLGVTFSVPVTSIRFGLAESAFVPLFGVSVILSDFSLHSFNLTLVDPFAEGQFVYSGAPVTGLFLSPAPGAAALAFDNLDVTPSAVPEQPSVVLLLGIGIAALAGFESIFRATRAARSASGTGNERRISTRCT